MTFSQWLDAERGRLARVARHFGITAGAVSQWRDNGVPRERMLAVRRMSNDQVGLEEMLSGANGAPSIPTTEELRDAA